MQQGEEYRNKWALGLTITLSLFIFISFAFYKGFIDLPSGGVIAEKQLSVQVASVASADEAPSPLENSKRTFGAAFQEIAKQYQLFKDSISSVLVPFVTGIEVYERK